MVVAHLRPTCWLHSCSRNLLDVSPSSLAPSAPAVGTVTVDQKLMFANIHLSRNFDLPIREGTGDFDEIGVLVGNTVVVVDKVIVGSVVADPGGNVVMVGSEGLGSSGHLR